ncbi:MAG: TIGR03619 family F420-dependent LLM class oxidoreductase [Pseudomonadota bacterium]
MKFGTFSTFMSPLATADMIIDFGRRAENIGLESIWLGEHVVLFNEMEFPYPGSKDGKIPVPEGGGLLDTVPTFGLLAGVTKTLRFGTGIALVPQRNPIYTAKEFATLDWLTGGRMDLGVGVGWCKEEVIACGYEWETRGARCNEFLALFQQLWTEEVTTFEGKHVKVEKVRMDPKPVQKPHIPIIVGGYADAAYRRAARFGQGWYGFNTTPAATAAALQRLDQILAEAGRSRGEGFETVITPPYVFSADDIKAYADLGVDRIVVQLGSQKPEKIDQRLRYIEGLIAADANQ